MGWLFKIHKDLKNDFSLFTHLFKRIKKEGLNKQDITIYLLLMLLLLLSRSGSTYILERLAYGMISLTLFSMLSITNSILSVSKLSTKLTSIAIKTSSGAKIH